jgi:hypothetical protein
LLLVLARRSVFLGRQRRDEHDDRKTDQCPLAHGERHQQNDDRAATPGIG